MDFHPNIYLFAPDLFFSNMAYDGIQYGSGLDACHMVHGDTSGLRLGWFEFVLVVQILLRQVETRPSRQESWITWWNIQKQSKPNQVPNWMCRPVTVINQTYLGNY